MEIRNRGSDTLVVTINGELDNFTKFEWNEWGTCTIKDGMATVRDDGCNFVACFMLNYVTRIQRK